MLVKYRVLLQEWEMALVKKKIRDGSIMVVLVGGRSRLQESLVERWGYREKIKAFFLGEGCILQLRGEILREQARG